MELNKFSMNSSIGVLDETGGAGELGCLLPELIFVLFFVSLYQLLSTSIVFSCMSYSSGNIELVEDPRTSSKPNVVP